MVTIRSLAGLLLGASLAAGLPAIAQDTAARDTADPAEAIREVLESTQPDMRIESIAPSPVDGLYEVTLQNGQYLYASDDARYFIPGDLYEATPAGLVNNTESKRNAWRAERVAAVDPDSMIVFAPEGESLAELTVFTDVDCPYCRQLHDEVPRLNELGIAVRYLAYPRTGLEGETYRKMIATWCADDRQDALTRAKNGDAVGEADCDHPVDRHYQLGRDVGVTGTPALLLEDGTLVPGYVPADTLAGYLLEDRSGGAP